MTPATPYVHSEGGFTLVELLVAMSVLALLSLTLYASLSLGSRAWTSNASRTIATNEIVRAQGELRALLGAAYPLFSSGDETGDAVAATHRRIEFTGASDHVSFLAPASALLGGIGNDSITLGAVDSGDGIDLAVAARPELAADPSVSVNRDLLRGLSSLRFTYFGPDKDHKTPYWQDSWTDRTRLPLLVRISAAFGARDARSWPDLVIATQIGADATCVFDISTHYCEGR